MQGEAIERYMMPHFQYLPELSKQLAMAIVRMRDALNAPPSDRSW